MPRFRSRLEGAVAAVLSDQGLDWEYEQARLGYTIEHVYTPDFRLPNGIFLEVKGYFSPEDRRKMLAVKKANPDADIRMVFSNPHQRISKTSKTTYKSWCDKHQIPSCSSTSIPLLWLRHPPSLQTQTQTSSKRSTPSSPACSKVSPSPAGTRQTRSSRPPTKQ